MPCSERPSAQLGDTLLLNASEYRHHPPSVPVLATSVLHATLDLSVTVFGLYLCELRAKALLLMLLPYVTQYIAHDTKQHRFTQQRPISEIIVSKLIKILKSTL